MNGQYYIENNFQIFGPHGFTGYYIVTTFIFGPNAVNTHFWINENSHIFGPNGASGFWIEDGRIFGTGQAPWDS
jgi:hypothetical protein